MPESLRPDWSIDEQAPPLETCADCGREGLLGRDLELGAGERLLCGPCTDRRADARTRRLASGSSGD